MDIWDSYQNTTFARGVAKRDVARIRESRSLKNNLPNSLSYHSVDIYTGENGYDIGRFQDATDFRRDVAIINSDNLNEKYIFSLPGEDIEHGGLVHWMDNYWLVAERDANTTLYTKAKLIQCNHLLKWVGRDNKIHEQWSVIEDGTKYLTGELEDRQFIVTRGDSRISLMVARNSLTKIFNRQNRFLIDDPESPIKLAYALTKPLKLGWSYNCEGVYKFVLQEINSTSDDNQELGIADYYKYFPRESSGNTSSTDGVVNGKRVYL